MAVQAENLCFDGNMSMDCFMGSVFGIEDGFSDLNTVVDPYGNNLQAAASSFSYGCPLPVEMMQSLSSDLEKQRVEMDWFLQMENKRLRSSIMQEESRLQAIIMQKYESSINNLIQQKDEELAVARNKTTELQDFMKVAEMEAKAWEKKATEKEAVISHLKNRLIQAQEVHDTMSLCDSSSSSTGDRNEKKKKKTVCKLCQARNSCVVFFPCRHLCCCKSCEPLSWHCPVCQTVKAASLEVYLA